MDTLKELLFGQPILGIVAIFLLVMIVKGVIKFSIKAAFMVFLVSAVAYYFLGVNFFN